MIRLQTCKEYTEGVFGCQQPKKQEFSTDEYKQMTKPKPQTIYRKDYQPSPFLIETIDLCFRLNKEKTTVIAKIRFFKNPLNKSEPDTLVLNGEQLELKSVKVNGKELHSSDYTVTDHSLEIRQIGERFETEITTIIDPKNNSSLEGLYRSSGNYCTQCEAEGFRRITYSIDRPDVLARYTTRIEGNRKSCPVLLSNGNLIEKGEISADCHYAVWQDPHPKPCYLFALVAGDLVRLEDQFITHSGRAIDLHFYVEKRNRKKCDHAIRSLKKAMKWDEQVFGLEYDLDCYMIVAVDDFNMGAMENKGLNIFNSKYVLATPETATDQDYLGIEGVIAHEYFHNWTGNRVTCRDWFQLSLKEGLTVFRDQQFSGDMNSTTVQRIEDVQVLRGYQFKEDSGPMAHPVRPDSYVEINNFYTVTVYNKGAEVIRMMHTLLGRQRFRKGMDIYFDRHDGQAVTCEDFVLAMEAGSGIDLQQFRRWYSQAGTPVLQIEETFSQKEMTYTVTIQQSNRRDEAHYQKPFHIPIGLGLLDQDGKELECSVKMDGQPVTNNNLIELKKSSHTLVFQTVQEKPVLSILRHFSAPVTIQEFQTREELAFLMKHDSDLFNRWDASQKLSQSIILENVLRLQKGDQPEIDPLFVDSFLSNLKNDHKDQSLTALSLGLPSEIYLAQQMNVIDPVALHKARQSVRLHICNRLKDELVRVYQHNREDEYSIDTRSIGKRSLKNICLYYLMASESEDSSIIDLCINQYYRSANMTDIFGAFKLIVHSDCKEKQPILDDFYTRYSSDPLVVDKWLTAQSTSPQENCLQTVKELLEHSSFSIKNPNKVRALIGSFSSMNHYRFHASGEDGYCFLADRIHEIDSFNPQIAARLATPLVGWKRYESRNQKLMKAQLQRLIDTETLSKDVYEIVSKSLNLKQ